MIISKLFNSIKGKRGLQKNRTICELHRELYDLCVLGLCKKDPELMYKMVKILEDALIMGVKMNNKLVKYKLGSASKWDKKEYRKSDMSKLERERMREERKRLEKILSENETFLKKFRK